ncbi:hydrogenase expression/formation protein HypE [Microbulbifer sp.]|uniref:hydrogenase expression/formation protein HypE n=1 Tax=Microbulbifer sp. TaxID=1908541 RepID=UPI003F2DE089
MSDITAEHRARSAIQEARIDLSHGSGGRAMRDLVNDVFLSAFANPTLAALEDQARIPLADLCAAGDRLAFTTDSYVVDPLFFPGGDIGELAVNGTVNDLAVSGAVPLYLSCGVILEEGFALADLRRIAGSMARAAEAAGVQIVTGDTKVVPKGAADKLFINTSGVGAIPAGVEIAAGRARPGDRILVNSFIGDHGVAILAAREELALQVPIESDTRPLNGLVRALLDACPQVHCLRDATRGGLATVLNEFAESAGVCMELEEAAIPVRDEVRGVSEILGLDPLYYANEGVLVAVVPESCAERALATMRAHPAGAGAASIGEITAEPAGRVVMRSGFGGGRIVDMLIGEQLPRIC